ncbi:unnamed protein product [Eruca vesicaria subsp. sativa]|uniref:Uncharacterized protein n=1 Tax=Eruca vesicaria subsp. sativa TaxID=29727 RepID=A0ABC8LQX1_ERUVS|nr:unnamed protein product [Eruca vesicaria subsp. sativa]
MSRYFTSPTPVYARNWTNGQNLVESTKIERQIVSSKKVHRKEKERKIEKKLKNEKTIEHIYLPTKQLSDESDHLEGSCLTDEPVEYLSDGSQNSKKRRREASPVVESNIKAKPVTVNPLRIRFVFKKPKETVALVPQEPQEDHVCSTSGTSSDLSHDENLPSTSPESDKTASLSESKKKKKHKTSKESRYSSLFDEPVLPCLSMEEDSSNSDGWLISARLQESSPTKCNTSEDTVINVQKSEACFPSSKFLSEVGMFSLPYTVLF